MKPINPDKPIITFSITPRQIAGMLEIDLNNYLIIPAPSDRLAEICGEAFQRFKASEFFCGINGDNFCKRHLCEYLGDWLDANPRYLEPTVAE